MSNNRQIRSFAHRLAAGFVNEAHTHTWDQLLYASRGVLSVHTGEGTWVVPPLRACWIPADVEHGFRAQGEVELRTLYLPENFVGALPRACCVVTISPLVRELILHMVQMQAVNVDDDWALVTLFRAQLGEMSRVRLHLPWPRDPRAVSLARSMEARENGAAPIDALCRRAGASRRTLERIFVAETGVSLGRWRTQHRITRAMALLADGAPVARVAEELGYQTPSAFVEMFRRNLGETPGRFHRRWNAGADPPPATAVVPVPTRVAATGEYLGPPLENAVERQRS